MSGWTWAWLGWGGMFAVIEGLALARKRSRPDTLSEHVWWLRDSHRAVKAALGVGWAWLTWHFFFG